MTKLVVGQAYQLLVHVLQGPFKINVVYSTLTALTQLPKP